MSLSSLKEAILAQATAEANATLQQGAAHVKNEQQKTTAQLRELEESIVGRARLEGLRQSRMIHQKAELTGRALILNAKQEELEKTADAFVAHLLELDAKASKQLHEALIATLPKTKGTIVAGKHSEKIIADIAQKDYTIAKETLPNEGGFIFQGDRVEINNTFSHLARQLLTNHRAEIAHELFS